MNESAMKALADRVVALGVGSKQEIMAGGYGNAHPETVYLVEGSIGGGSPSVFLNDGRVVLALMAKVRSDANHALNALRWINLMRDIRRIPLDAKSLYIAIIEACCAALENKDG